ncbi:TetR/AcrR family transcriptional regulator [Lentimicrobium sp.]|jgi:AcrR family transcriptional regulator|uniref:TetR/AcrR family transcriptional regulator n=1 Tax=Lentimicrobium sp. TaxID=2034841 RepID=UPI0025E9B9B0|nr:TetR/AcrR family transcriptional regulator [Lentimicrobium sp.]MCO5256568.1 TetR/AcrR family transcriptional regulator [Lentimicrobium sp.]HOP12802.1 TetR/AcrR family transcriptional regulator [Lentimicrobium sp.]HPF64613.1 TetR/AcrR family transcriptional regulator [Lentimicrobium sp.]HPJ62081.1 TetR/AcrR family transcriptional regulator [Lentimicrobium sp.]HPR24827.1 TetR/AcrR family transcriptional regulator [Lentimicrobium sp.]
MLDKEEVKSSIVTVARQIFSRFGFKKTTMDEIALASRKGKSSIYYYFESKEDIFQAVVEKEASMLKRELQEAIKPIGDPREKLKVYVLVRMNTLKKLANYYDAIRSEYLSHLDFVENIRKKYDDEEISMVEAILKEGAEKMEFNIENTRLAAIAIVTAMKGLEIPMFWQNNADFDMEKRLDDLINILFYGLVRR